MNKVTFNTIFEQVKAGFFNGLGFSLGVTIGIAVVSTIIIHIIRLGGGLPLVGEFLGSIVEATEQAIENR